MRGIVLCGALLTALAAGCDDGGGAAEPASPDAEVAADGARTPDGATPDAGADATARAMDAAPDGPAPDGAVPEGGPPDGAPPILGPGDCDPLVPGICAMPWPSNLYLSEDATRRTGYRLAFGAETLPRNTERKAVDPTPYRRMDGYSVGTPILALFPGLDPANLPDEAGLAASMAADAPILLFEDRGEAGLRRVPYFTELDRRDDDPVTRTLYVRPAEILDEATRYLVAFRDLRGADGERLPPSEAFAALRDGLAEGVGELSPRVPRFERAFADLEAAGVERGTLQLAWDFETASCDAIHGPILAMRADAIARTDPDGPELLIDEIQRFTPEQNPNIAIRLVGRFRVPNYMKSDGPFQDTEGFVLNFGADGAPQADGWSEPTFVVRIPHGATDGTPHGLIQYGHGLNGTWGQVESEVHDRTAHEDHYIYFGASMTGMSHDDVPRIVGILFDISRFPWLGDRLHQGLIESILLPRAMMHRLQQVPEVRDAGVVIDPTRVFWEGDSQGGIYGATHVALSPDVTRGMLGVPGQNYSTMLQRSVDFDPFFFVIDTSYPDPKDQAVVLGLVQTLWDGSDPVSYYRHLSLEPFPGDAPNAVLLGPARGDWQVPLITVETAARSGLGVAIMAHYDDERGVPLVDPAPYPHTGSAVVNWHFGNAWPPAGNLPPDDDVGDPHGKPRREPAYRRQMVHFFETGEVIDVCEDGTCPPPPMP